MGDTNTGGSERPECRYCSRILPFDAAREYHEHLHDTNAWGRGPRGAF